VGTIALIVRDVAPEAARAIEACLERAEMVLVLTDYEYGEGEIAELIRDARVVEKIFSDTGYTLTIRDSTVPLSEPPPVAYRHHRGGIGRD
jgi:hypothetical protein